MRRGIRMLQGFKVTRCAAYLIDNNEYLSTFHGAKASDKIDNMELIEIFLNSAPNSCIRRVYFQGFRRKYIALNMHTCLNTWKYQIIFIKVLYMLNIGKK